MTKTMTTDKPTDRQIAFLLDLIVDREVDAGKNATETTIALTKWLATPRSKKDVSRLIDKALASPKRAKPAPAAAKPTAVVVPDSVPNLKFALRSELLTSIPESWKRQEFVFVEVKNFHGKRVFRRLLGAPGAFSRYPVSREVARELVGHLSNQKVALDASTAFAELYSVCKRCAAELTDDHSRLVRMGPVCEKLVDEWLVTGKEPSTV